MSLPDADRILRPHSDRIAPFMSSLPAFHVFFLLLLSQQRPAPEPPLFQQFQTLKWDTSYDDWRKTHPAAACRAFDGSAQLADEDWCYRCLETAGTRNYEWSFYAFDVAAPACRLGQLRAWETGAAINESRRALESALVARYGSAGQVNNVVGELSSGFWRDIRHWSDAQGEVYLYRREQHGQPEAVELLARSPQLVAEKVVDKTLAELDSDQLAPTGTPLDRKLMRDLGAEFSGVRTLLAEESDEKRRPLQRQTLEQLLAAVPAASFHRKPELLLAADRIASLIPEAQTGDPASNHRTQTIAGFQLSYLYSPLAAIWPYQHDLLERVWRDYAKTEWGDLAFLLYERMGWDPGGTCAQGSDQFRAVITHGEKFLADHPSGPQHLEVLLAVGTAFETWWSLSRARANDDYVQPEKYRPAAHAARIRAIHIYAQVAGEAPQSPEAAYARRQLPRLKLALDTAQRRFYCIYD